MFLPSKEKAAPAQPQQGIFLGAESKKLKLIRVLTKWSAYGFCFGLGVVLASFTRLVPGTGILYWGFLLAFSGYLLVVKEEDASTELISLRRVSGLAFALSTLTYWDAVGAVVFNPITLTIPFSGYQFILPAWFFAVCVVLLCVGLGMMFWGASQR